MIGSNLDVVGSWTWPLRLVVVILSCSVLGGISYFVLLPGQQQQLQMAEQTHATLRATFKQRQEKVAHLTVYRAQQTLLQNVLHEFLQPVSSEDAMADLLIAISQTALTAGVSFELFQPQSMVQDGLYTALPVKLRVVGRYHALGTFMSGLANHARLMTAHDLKIQPKSPSDSNQKASLLTLEATIRAYRVANPDNG